MAIVTIQAPALNNIQKKRIGERVMDALHNEGVSASRTIIMFKSEDSDIYLDGGLLIEAKPPLAAQVSPNTITTVIKQPVQPLARESLSLPKHGALSMPDYSEVKEKVLKILVDKGTISSFQAQAGLSLKGFDGASALLRRVFAELEAEGTVEKQGQKRGTRYVLKGITSGQPQNSAPVILVKSEKPVASEQTSGYLT